MNILIEELKKGVEEIGLSINEEKLDKFQKYYQFLLETNKKVNLTAMTEERDVAIKHFVDSLTCFKAIAIEDGQSLADIGTGAGFPGLPMKIYQPGLKVTLVDSLDKRITFLRNVIERLGLAGIQAIHARAEEVGRDNQLRESFDLAVARAVAGLAVLAEYCLPVVRTQGYFLALKGPRADEEIDSSLKAIEIIGGEIQKTVKLNLPLTGDERTIIVIKKVRKTPENYPRRPGIPAKKPL